MKKIFLAFLALSAATLPARSASPEFSVELFSHRTFKELTLEATDKIASICGAKVDGPCLVVPPTRRISCYASGRVRCRLDALDRSFAFLTITSTTPIHIAPAFAGLSEPPQVFLIGNARVTVSSLGLKVITRVDLESYVSGVLRGEASVIQAPAARQAMAILARTWALRWQGRHGKEGFDFCSLTHCQVFRLPQQIKAYAASGLDPAALATRGQVLKYHGALADPYFTACCGGVTEAAGNVWPDRAEPYLVSIHDPYCSADAHASWKNTLSAESVRQVLREALRLPVTAPLDELSVEKRDSSGRAIVLCAAAGAAWNIDANQFRYAVDRRLGWQQIKSNLYTIGRQGGSLTFSGHGLGHGVGLCQAGAEQRARLGLSTEQILSTYFPGTEIGAQRPGDPDPIASSEHFELAYPDSQETWVGETLDTLEHWRRQLGAHAGVLPLRVRVTTWATVAEFISATGEPGWMAAASDGQSIALQPLALLAREQILHQTLRHELTHLVVHRLSAKGVPRWFEEGLVLYLTGERIEARPAAFKTTNELEDAIIKPRSEAEMKAAYARALERVRQIARREGAAALWRLLEHPEEKTLRWGQEGR